MSESRETSPWQYVLKADYQWRFYLEAAIRNRRLNVIIQGAVVMLSGGAAASVAGGVASLAIGGLALGGAIGAAIAAQGGFAVKAGRFEAQSKLWLKIRADARELHSREQDGKDVTDDFSLLRRNYENLFEQEQEKPPLKTQERLYDETMRSYGYPIEAAIP